MKKILYLSLFLSCLITMSYTSVSTTTTTTTTTTELNIKNLSKKWKLEKYSVGIFSEDPSEKEKNDYIYLSSDMTFTSISEGNFEKGTWALKAKDKRIVLSKSTEKKSLILIVDKLTSHELTLIIDDPSDKEAKYLNIHFKN